MSGFSISLNGEDHALPQALTLRELVAFLGLSEKGLGLEHNGQMVPHDAWDTLPLAPGDRVEVVRFVGGG